MNEAYLQTSSTTAQNAPYSQQGLKFTRRFTKDGVSPYDEIQWEKRTASITDTKGNTIFEQRDVEIPIDWSMTATNIVASKYLHGQIGTPERETGVRMLVGRVAETIRDWGLKGGYFASTEDAGIFYDELTHMLLTQKVAFNSPVWFNVGCDRLEPNSDGQNWHFDPVTGGVRYSATGYKNPQCSACFINSVEDSLDSILTLAKTEGMLFKWGSGTGTNLSTIRGSKETLSGGGEASGPLSFMRGFDAFAGVIKSGGKTRRAAKMVILNVDHPDIMDFIDCKAKEEAKAFTLIRAGYDGSGPDSEAYSSIFFQNANNSVRVSDEFMRAYENDGDFTTYTREGPSARRDLQGARHHDARSPKPPGCAAIPACSSTPPSTSGTPARTRRASTRRIHARSTCSSTTRPATWPASTCSSTLRRREHSISRPIATPSPSSSRPWRSWSTTPAIPTEAIARNSHDYRPLGLGYANLGALLMAFGLPYDSAAGRDLAAASPPSCADRLICSRPSSPPTARRSPRPRRSPHRVERQGGACPGFYVNREPFLDVIRMHRAEVNNIGKSRTERRALQRAAARRAHRRQPRKLGHGAHLRRAATAIATRRPPFSRPPAPSAS